MADHILVTQGLQNWQHSIPLFEGKRTLVRFFSWAADHGPQPQNCYHSLARMEVYRGVWKVATLDPINSNTGAACVPLANHVNDRTTTLNPFQSHDYELPSDLLNGTLTLKAEINPGCLFDSGMQREWICGNNKREITVTFVSPPPLSIGLFAVGYYLPDGSLSTRPTYEQIMEHYTWMRQAFPITNAHWFYHTWTTSATFDSDTQIGPSFGTVLNELGEKYLWEEAHGARPYFFGRPGKKTYAAFTAYQNPSGPLGLAWCPGRTSIQVGSHPSGVDIKDVFAEELGHNMGRWHAPCGVAADNWLDLEYPYDDARISGETHEYAALQAFEFTSSGYQLIPPTTKDFMSYCWPNWISDYTFWGIHDHLTSEAAQAATSEPARLAAARDYLLVSGTIDPHTNEAHLSPLFVISSDLAYQPQRGDYAIVLRDARGVELTRYPFTPEQSVARFMNQPEIDETLSVSKLVPYHHSTEGVDLLGPGDRLLASVRASRNPPQVTLLSPNGGEVLNRDPIRITWRARDVDGDPLTFNVGYSADDGRTWQLIARGVTGSSVEVPASSVPASNRGRMQVWVSDGIHTASDISDGSFVVPNRPPMVEIIQPEDGRVVVAGQTVFFQALAYDVDLPDGAGLDVQWRSDLDGPLWQGAEFATASLSVGTHRILVRVDDGAGGKRSASVTVRVVASFDDLPSKRDQLGAYPESLYLYPLQGATSGNIYLHNVYNLTSIPWQALSDQKWLRLSHSSGETPDTLIASVAEDALPPGVHTASVTIINSAAPTQQEVVEVQVRMEHDLFPQCALPLVFK